MDNSETVTSVDVDVSDEDLFNSALDQTEPEATAQPEPTQEQPEGQPRDETGRFAAKAEDKPEPEATEAAAPEPTQEQPHRVPISELLSTRDRAQKAEAERDVFRQQYETMQRQIAEMQRASQQPRQQEQRQPERPDPLLDPEGYDRFMEHRMNERLLTERREMSLQMAARFYKDEFPEAYKAAQTAVGSGDIALQARMNASADPGETLLQWYREQRTMKEVGSDPAAYRQKILDEALKDPAYLAKAIAQSRALAGQPAGNAAPNVQLPPSLSRATGGSNRVPQLSEADMSDDALFSHALRS